MYDKIKNYYCVIDTIVIPRLNRKVCRIISPIKPLEAMAYNKLVITSDLPAIRLYINPYETRILFKPEDSHDLTNKISEFTSSTDSFREIVRNAYNNVVKNFN